jgi:tRNA-splicing ligase RtcB (3'-phosphate/5'-hydroxy nucleic acid ligase)
MKMHRLDRFRLELRREGSMKTSALVYLHEAMKPEREALSQLCDAASLDEEAIVLATPDIHTGYGVPIGSVLASPSLVSPAAVGYDVSCGMRLLLSLLDVEEASVKELARAIKEELPLGEGKRNSRFELKERQLEMVLGRGVGGLVDVVANDAELARVVDPERTGIDRRRIEDGGALEGEPGEVSSRAVRRGLSQLGTLGGGNHFVEIQKVGELPDESVGRALGMRRGQLAVMIHTGSRGLGHQVAADHMRIANDAASRYGILRPNRQLSCMPADSPEGRSYLGAMRAAANFASANRQVITEIVRGAFARVLESRAGLTTVYDVSHNVAKREKHGGRWLYVHRKGATRAFPPERMRGSDFARLGQPVLVPGSMGTASYVLLPGERVDESLCSVNHGAGRAMSRTAAAGKIRRRDGKVIRPGAISQSRFRESMRGVYLECEDRRAIVEEAPDAYKDIDLVVETVEGAGLGRAVARLVPLGVLKG